MPALHARVSRDVADLFGSCRKPFAFDVMRRSAARARLRSRCSFAVPNDRLITVRTTHSYFLVLDLLDLTPQIGY